MLSSRRQSLLAALTSVLLFLSLPRAAAGDAANWGYSGSVRMSLGSSLVSRRALADTDSVLAVAYRLVAATAANDTATLRRLAASDSLLYWNQSLPSDARVAFAMVAHLELLELWRPKDKPGRVMAVLRLGYRRGYAGFCGNPSMREEITIRLVPVGVSFKVDRWSTDIC
jgi:hypothetical protein